MAKQRMVNTRFWSDSFVVDKLNALDRLLFLYLLTNNKTNIIGIYELPIRTAAFETGIDRDDLEKMLKRLSPKVEYFDGWVYIRQFAEHQMYNPNVDKGMQRELSGLPKKVLKKLERLGVESDRLLKAIQSLSLEFVKPKPKPKPKLSKTSFTKTGDESPKDKKKLVKRDDEIARLYYEAIKRLDLPVRNHTTLKKKIAEMSREPDRQKVVNYLLFMRDQFADTDWPYKPDINFDLDIYSKRKQIKNSMERYLTQRKSNLVVIP